MSIKDISDQIHKRKVIVEPTNSGGFLAMDDTGIVRDFSTPQEVLRWISQRDKKAEQRGVSTITAIEWRNMPKGFTPPNG